MLDSEEFKIAYKLYGDLFDPKNISKYREVRAKPLLDYYNNLTGFGETEPNAIMHHCISQLEVQLK